MSHDEVDYYQRRAEAQIALAQKSSNSNAVQAHYQIATAYLDRIHGMVSCDEEPSESQAA